jgi:hypothetical protein
MPPAPAEFPVDAAGIDHVIAVGTAFSGLEKRGCVEMADAQIAEIVHDSGNLIEAEIGPQLDAVGG